MPSSARSPTRAPARATADHASAGCCCPSRRRTCEADLYGQVRKVHYKELAAQWYRACGVRLLRVVVVKVSTGTLGCRVFFCTDPTRSVREILEGYAERWAIEVCFRNLKQDLGFAQSS